MSGASGGDMRRQCGRGGSWPPWLWKNVYLIQKAVGNHCCVEGKEVTRSNLRLRSSGGCSMESGPAEAPEGKE